MNILVIPSWYPPTGGEFFREHSIALAKVGLNMHVLAGVEIGLTRYPGAYLCKWRSKTNLIEGVTEKQRYIRRIPLLNKQNALLWAGRIMKMYEKHTDGLQHPDLIQTHSSMWAGLAAARIKQKWGTPFVITEHRGRFTGIGQLAPKLIKAWHKPLLSEAFQFADHIVTVSASLQKTIKDIYPPCSSKLSVIPNMTDTGFFTPAIQQSRKTTSFTFLCIAHLEPLKGIDMLMHAFSLLQQRLKQETRLIIAGGGPERKRLHRLKKSLNLENKVEFTGPLQKKEILQHMQLADAFVLPSHHEAFGIVLIEAMACGLPLIATRSGGPDHIVSEKTGLLCTPGDAQSLCLAMQKMCMQYHLYDKEMIRALCVSKYSLEAVSARYAELYTKLLHGT